MDTTVPRSAPRAQRDAIVVLLYYAAYFGYLFVHQESELEHWLSLVLLPFGLLFLLGRSRSDIGVRGTLAEVGLVRGALTRGLSWAVPLGLGLSILQLVVSRDSDAFLELLGTAKAPLLFLIALAFLLFTTGWTEEFFFRGVLQRRLSAWAGSPWVAMVLASLLFGLYHLPYAYLNPHWPSHGDLAWAFRLAMFEGTLGGLVLGAVYVKARRNLLACVVVHALIDVLPAMTMIKFGGGG